MWTISLIHLTIFLQWFSYIIIKYAPSMLSMQHRVSSPCWRLWMFFWITMPPSSVRWTHIPLLWSPGPRITIPLCKFTNETLKRHLAVNLCPNLWLKYAHFGDLSSTQVCHIMKIPLVYKTAWSLLSQHWLLIIIVIPLCSTRGALYIYILCKALIGKL